MMRLPSRRGFAVCCEYRRIRLTYRQWLEAVLEILEKGLTGGNSR